MARFPNLLSVNVDAVLAGAGDVGAGVLVAAPGAGKKIRVHAYQLTLTAAGAAKFRKVANGAGTTADDLRTVRASAAGQGAAESVERPDFLFELPENTPLYLNVNAALTLSGGVTYSIVGLAD